MDKDSSSPTYIEKSGLDPLMSPVKSYAENPSLTTDAEMVLPEDGTVEAKPTTAVPRSGFVTVKFAIKQSSHRRAYLKFHYTYYKNQ